MSRAAEPDTIGAAPEVPPNGVSSVPVPASAETEAPGAPISGLIVLPLISGPRALEPTMCMISGMPKAGSMVIAVSGMPDLRASLSAWLIM